MTVPLNVVSYALLGLIVTVYAAAVLFYPPAYIVLTYENLVGEWSQVGFFLLAGALSVWTVVQRYPNRWFFTVLGLAACYVALEEISWGQQLFNWASPQFFVEQNLQGETNLHNLVAGPFTTTLKTALSIGIAAVLIGYGCIFPWMMHVWPQRLAWISNLGVLAPPAFIAPYFAIAALFELGLFNFNEAEVAELLIGSALLILVVHYRSVGGGHDSGGRMLAALIVVVGLFAIAMTGVTVASDTSRALVKSRMLDGLESFGGRYAGYNAWQSSIGLYELRLRYEPWRVSTRRRLASTYTAAGMPQQANETYLEAIERELARLEQEPDNSLLHLSLAQTYAQMGKAARARWHNEQALGIADALLSDQKSNGAANFSKALALDALGETELALKFAKAALQADSGRYDYRRVVHNLERKLETIKARPAH